MNKRCFQTLIVSSFAFFLVSHAAAHCEVPCGIYDDQMRIKMMAEHVTTIEKSMKEILKLERESPINYNQLVRWVMNKERHANELQEIITRYFMTQRIKPGTEGYSEKMGLLHKTLVSAMKCKQTTDISHIIELRSLLKRFQDLYFGPSRR
jgi:nickel superoxide dismutase